MTLKRERSPQNLQKGKYIENPMRREFIDLVPFFFFCNLKRDLFSILLLAVSLLILEAYFLMNCY